MILKALERTDFSFFSGTQFETVSEANRLKMLNASKEQLSGGKYYEMFSVIENEECVGFISIFAHSQHIVSLGVDIREKYKRKGYGYNAMLLAEKIAKEKGYRIISDSIATENTASRRMHEKLGFEFDREYKRDTGKEICIYLKIMQIE